MATYLEIHAALVGTDFDNLKKRLFVAVIKKAQSIIASPSNHPYSRRQWAANVFDDPDQESERMLQYLVAEYSEVAINAIAAVDDATAQDAVNDAVDLIFNY